MGQEEEIVALSSHQAFHLKTGDSFTRSERRNERNRSKAGGLRPPAKANPGDAVPRLSGCGTPCYSPPRCT